jgi:hypothetical protein
MSRTQTWRSIFLQLGIPMCLQYKVKNSSTQYNRLFIHKTNWKQWFLWTSITHLSTCQHTLCCITVLHGWCSVQVSRTTLQWTNLTLCPAGFTKPICSLVLCPCDGHQCTLELPAPSPNMVPSYYTTTTHLQQMAVNFRCGNVLPIKTVSRHTVYVTKFPVS